VTAILAATRAVQFASTLFVFGTIAFALFVARPAGDRTAQRALGWESVERRLRRMVLWALAIGVAALVLWLALEVPLMSGEELEDALTGPTFGIVVTQTWFGRVFITRVALALLLIGWLAANRRRGLASAGALTIAAAYAALPALAGHAAGGQGEERYFRIVADMLHLVAAGGWIGALPGLALSLAAARRAPPAIDLAARITLRFSGYGTIVVAALLISGTINTSHLVRSVDSLTDTEYGRLLLAKLALVAAMLAVAAVNRWSLSRRIAAGESLALAALLRNTSLEIIAGVAVIAIVGKLGITVPAMHPMHHGLHSEASRAMISSSVTIRC
jgi:putative copper resistance protein D